MHSNMPVRWPRATAEWRHIPVEARGQGGGTVIAPSTGARHPLGKPWVLIRGSIDQLPYLTTEHRDALFDVGRTFDERPVGGGGE